MPSAPFAPPLRSFRRCGADRAGQALGRAYRYRDRAGCGRRTGQRRRGPRADGHGRDAESGRAPPGVGRAQFDCHHRQHASDWPAIDLPTATLATFRIKGYDAPAHVWQVTGTVHAADSFALLRPDMPPRKETAHWRRFHVTRRTRAGTGPASGLLGAGRRGRGSRGVADGRPWHRQVTPCPDVDCQHRVRVSRAARVALFGISRQQPAASDHRAALERAELEPSGFRRDQAGEARRLLCALPGFVDGGPSAADLAALVAAIEALSRFRR